MTNPPPVVNREQFTAGAQLLRRTVVSADGLLKVPLDEPTKFFYAGSPAESDASRFGTEIVDDMLSHVVLLMVASLDHGDCLAGWGDGAVAGLPTPIFPAWSVARSIVEACATVSWLVEEDLDPRVRSERALTEAMVDATSRWVERADAKTRRGEIDEAANKLGLVKTTEEFLTFFGERPPSRNSMVKKLLPGPKGFDHYSLLSGVSHSEPWAIQSVGYSATHDPASPGHTHLIKTPRPEYLFLAIMISENAIAAASAAVDAYRGRPSPK